MPPFTKSKKSQSQAKAKSASKRPLPPGQRLVRYIGLAGLVCLLQAASLPAGNFSATASLSTTAVDTIQPFRLAYPLGDLMDGIKKSSNKKRLRTGVFVVEPKTGRYADMNSHDAFASASIIKFPVLVSLLSAIERQQISFDQQLTMRQDLVAGGSGCLQWRPVGTKITVKNAAELMMVISDNTATNMLIDALGGRDRLNRQFANWGLEQTHISNWLADLGGTNKTSPYDLCFLLGRLERGEILCENSREWMYSVMERCRTRTLLPQGLGPGAKIAHKTGDIGSMVGDAGVVTTPEGIRYLVAIQVERPHNDRRANELIRNLSKQIYQGIMEPDPLLEAKMVDADLTGGVK